MDHWKENEHDKLNGCKMWGQLDDSLLQSGKIDNIELLGRPPSHEQTVKYRLPLRSPGSIGSQSFELCNPTSTWCRGNPPDAPDEHTGEWWGMSFNTIDTLVFIQLKQLFQDLLIRTDASTVLRRQPLAEHNLCAIFSVGDGHDMR